MLLLTCSCFTVAADATLPALGTIGSTGVYTTFVALGALVDGWVHGVYDETQVVNLVEVLEVFCSTCAQSVRDVLAERALAEEDSLYLEGIADAYDLLVVLVHRFLDWVETGDRATYDDARGRAWERIYEVLELEGESEGEGA